MIYLSRELQHSRHQVNEALGRFISALTHQDILLTQAMRHGVLLGGKRLRPFLVYQTGRLFGLMPCDLDAPAAAVECIHAYSLIHDDLPLMDNNNLRRGEPTCHIKFGETIAILAGDALQTLAFAILAESPMPTITLEYRVKMIASLANASGAEGMCLGQALDFTASSKQISLTHLESIHRHKTSALIRAAVHMGVLAAGNLGHEVQVPLDQYATAIGLAFQIQDDILDVVGNSQTTGKHHGADHELGKNTYPTLIGLDKARTKTHDLYHESLASLKHIASLGYDITRLVALARYIIERNH